MKSKNNLAEAQRLLREALKARDALDAEAAATLKSPSQSNVVGTLETASIMESLCSVMGEAGDLDEKAVLLERSLSIKRWFLSEEHPEVAVTLTSLADICYKRKNYQEAIEFHRIARSVRAKCKGEGDVSTVESMASIARCLRALGRFDEARSLFEQCVINLRALFDEMDSRVAAALGDLGDILQLLEQYSAALMAFERAGRIYSKTVGESSECVAHCHKRLGDLHRAQKNAHLAKASYVRALTAYRATTGPETDDAVQAMEGLIWALQALGSHDEAAALSAESIELHRKVYGSGDPRLASDLNALARLLRSRGKYTEASDYFNRALRVGLTIHGEDHENIAESLEGLAWIMDARGLSSEALPLRQRSRDIRGRLPPPSLDPGSSSGISEGKRDAASLLSNLSLLMSEKME
jgi:tetratricopeptide (TPR) repeat protein